MDLDYSDLLKDNLINKQLISEVLNDLVMYSIPPAQLIKLPKT